MNIKFNIGGGIRKIEKAAARLKNSAAGFAADESGMGTIEVVLILVVLIGLVVIFKEQITNLINSIFSRINSLSSGITGGV